MAHLARWASTRLPFLQYGLVPLESGTELFVELVVYDYRATSSQTDRHAALMLRY